MSHFTSYIEYLIDSIFNTNTVCSTCNFYEKLASYAGFITIYW